MYKQIHIEYSDPTHKLDPLTLKFNLTDFDITKRWVKKLEYCIDNLQIDDPCRFYGFDDFESEKSKSIDNINKVIEVINHYKPNFITKKVTDPVDQDTLNYLHHIFEVYHGLADQSHQFYLDAPLEVQKALRQLNLEVHKCEGYVSSQTVRRQLPTQMVTWYSLPKTDKLELSDYEHFTDFYEFGTIYLLYTEIGKTLQDLAIDHDHYISPEAYRPFRHYTSDFMIRFFSSVTKNWQTLRKKYRQHYLDNKDFYDSKNLGYDHPYNRPGNIPVAKLIPMPIDIVKELKNRQMVTKINLL